MNRAKLLDNIYKQLLLFMATKKPYLEHKISLPKLAKELNTTVHLLSKTINAKEKMNFFEFINKFRIDHACELITNNKILSIEGIAYESGFGNKTSFNRAFKKFKNCTPSLYKKQQVSK